MWTVTTMYIIFCMFGATAIGNTYISVKEIENVRAEQEKVQEEQTEDVESDAM